MTCGEADGRQARGQNPEETGPGARQEAGAHVLPWESIDAACLGDAQQTPQAVAGPPALLKLLGGLRGWKRGG